MRSMVINGVGKRKGKPRQHRSKHVTRQDETTDQGGGESQRFGELHPLKGSNASPMGQLILLKHEKKYSGDEVARPLWYARSLQNILCTYYADTSNIPMKQFICVLVLKHHVVEAWSNHHAPSDALAATGAHPGCASIRACSSKRIMIHWIQSETVVLHFF